ESLERSNPMDQDQIAEVLIAREAQRIGAQAEAPPPETVGQMKASILEPDQTDLKEGLAICDDSPRPRDMSAVDPGWQDFTERAEMAQTSESYAWQVAANTSQEAVLQQAISTMRSTVDDNWIVGAALHVATAAPSRYGEFL